MKLCCEFTLLNQVRGGRSLTCRSLLLLLALTTFHSLSFSVVLPQARALEEKQAAPFLDFFSPKVQDAAVTGLRFDQSGAINQGTITRTKVHSVVTTENNTVRREPVYPEDCYAIQPPGFFTFDLNISTGPSVTHGDYTLESGSATFVSSSTPPAPGLRVIVRNVTASMQGEPLPYTDREYDQGKVSEGFQVRFGTSHNGKHLAVIPGENQFSYTIKRGNTIVESGTFVADIQEETEEKTVHKTIIKERSIPEYSQAFTQRCTQKSK